MHACLSNEVVAKSTYLCHDTGHQQMHMYSSYASLRVHVEKYLCCLLPKYKCKRQQLLSTENLAFYVYICDYNITLFISSRCMHLFIAK